MCYTNSIDTLHKVCRKCSGQCQVKQAMNSMLAKVVTTDANRNIVEGNVININSCRQQTNNMRSEMTA